MTRTSAQKIGEEGERLFPSLLSTDFIPVQQDPDYGIDFMVQPFLDGNQPSGYHFGVAVRSASSLEKKNGYVTRQLEVKNVINYLDQRIPIFLVAIDLEAKEGFFLFIQNYIEELPSKKKWRNQKQLTFHIPTENNLSQSGHFTKAVQDSMEFINEKYPGSIPAAIEFEKKRLLGLDQRIQDIEMKIDGNHIHYNLVVSKDFCCRINFAPSAETRSKLLRVIERGFEEQFSRSEFEVLGAPVFEQVAKGNSSILTLGPRKPVEVEIALTALADNREPTMEPLYVPAQLRFGTKVATITVGRDEMPLGFQIVSPHDKSSSEVSMSFDPKKWIGVVVTLLPYFDHCHSLFRRMPLDSFVQFKVSHKGNLILTILCNIDQDLRLNEVLDTLDFVAQIREICFRFAINPPYPNSFSDEDIEKVRVLSSLVGTGRSERRVGGSTISFSANKEMISNLLNRVTLVPC